MRLYPSPYLHDELGAGRAVIAAIDTDRYRDRVARLDHVTGSFERSCRVLAYLHRHEGVTP